MLEIAVLVSWSLVLVRSKPCHDEVTSLRNKRVINLQLLRTSGLRPPSSAGFNHPSGISSNDGKMGSQFTASMERQISSCVTNRSDRNTCTLPLTTCSLDHLANCHGPFALPQLYVVYYLCHCPLAPKTGVLPFPAPLFFS